ncbi:transglutaminase-like domain-containing protein [Candidatus Woesearchaeota archaeon]|nr:transglutaminase-like domain-containing protein [Candidatus Woesearchaeota archaeon]
MKKIMFLVMFLVLAPAVISQEVYNAKDLIIDLSIMSEMDIIPQAGDYKIDYVIANLSFFPRHGFNQEVFGLTTTPGAEGIDESILFRWDNPPPGKLSFRVDSKVVTNSKRVEVKSKVRFPIEELPEDVLQYIEPSETIDSDNIDIIRQASKLAAGEDDLYAVAHNIGVWTKKNVDYDLSTLTVGVSQKASWVLQEKQGVCDEITNLFIAMLRSLGIPAKFISGVSYTEVIENRWGAHGWAEVYFPGYGWVPFDVTYGEFGYIDPTHITLNEAVDAEDPSTKYLWYGRDVDLRTKDLETRAELVEMAGKIEQPVRLYGIVVKDEVGFGSYNLIEAAVENLGDSYYATELHLSKPVEVSIHCCETKNVLLKPNERRKVYWTISIPDDLRETSIYTFPFVIWSSKNFTAQTSFKSSLLEKVYSLKEIQDIRAQKEVEETKTYSRNVDLSCSINKEEFYLEDNALVVCSVKNTGNVLLEDVRLCGDDDCGLFDLGISQIGYKEFRVSSSSVGGAEFVVKAENPDISKATYIKYTVLDKPAISIEDLNHPNSVSYGDEFSIEFLLNKKSLSTPKDVIVELYHGNIPKSWRMDKLNAESAFKVNLDSRDLGLNQNNFEIRVRYKDDAGNQYLETESFSMSLTDVPASQIALAALRSIVMKLGYKDLKGLVYILGVVAVVFITIVTYVIKKSKHQQ